MRTLAFIAMLSVSSFACEGKDIGDNDPIVQGQADARPTDANLDEPDAANPPDAMTSAAQQFCDTYESVCGYDAQNADRFDNEAACVSAYEGFDAARQTCVEGQLEGTPNCRNATGQGPCG